MKRTFVSKLLKEYRKMSGQEVLLKGWVYKIRKQSNFSFLLLREITGITQVFINDKRLLKMVETLRSESVVEIEGRVKIEKQAPGGVEIVASAIRMLTEPVEDLPIQVYEKGEEPELPIRLDYRWLDLRKPTKTLIFKIWTAMEGYMKDFWRDNNFIEIHSPKLVGIPSEGGAEAFKLNYFGKKAFLAQSPQFYKQMAMAAGFEKVFEIGAVYRAEKSFTGRHATEFIGVDMEISFIEKVENLLELEEEWLVHVLTQLKRDWGKEIEKVRGINIEIPSRPFPRFTVHELKEFLGTNGESISTEEEKSIGEYVKKNFSHNFVFITKWPWSTRPFYHMKCKDEPFSDSFDLVWKGVEVTTGAIREHRYDILKEQARGKNIPLENFESYFQFFKYGCPPHGGMGIGFERLLMQLLNISNIREVSLLARDPKRIMP